jgi:hypothetical protein
MSERLDVGGVIRRVFAELRKAHAPVPAEAAFSASDAQPGVSGQADAPDVPAAPTGDDPPAPAA